MQLAYIVIAHKNFPQIERLINRLDDAASDFLLIIDQKVDNDEFRSFCAAVHGRSNIQIIHNHTIAWGRFSLTEANIIGLKAHLARPRPFEYVFSLSGQDYPLMCPDDLRRTLRRADGKSFVEHFPFPVVHWIDGGSGRLFSWNFFLPGRRVLQLPKATRPRNPLVRLAYAVLSAAVPWRNALPDNMRPYGGSMHWTLSREAAEYINQFVSTNEKYTHRFRHTLVSDEIFFQTILANSPFKDKLINDDQRFLRWPEANAPSPCILTMTDLDALQGCGKMLARKFDSAVDMRILDAIDSFAESRCIPLRDVSD